MKKKTKKSVRTFRRLFLDVRSRQVPVDQRRLTAGQVTHNALGKRDQCEMKMEWTLFPAPFSLMFVWTHHFQFWYRPTQRPLLTVHERIWKRETVSQ